MTIKTIADISGDNAAHQISTDVYAKARFVSFTVTGGVARIGDSNVSSSRGVAMAQNATYTLPTDGAENGFDGYALSQIYAYVPTGSTLSITYGTR